jgi:hypothetical protein
MTRPQTKESLIAETESEYAALEKFLAALSPEQMIQPGALEEWSVKDVLAHLYAWQQMFFTWYETSLRGGTPPMPAEGYKWNQLPLLNNVIYLRYRELPLQEVLILFRASHQKMLAFISSLSAEELTQPGWYTWTGKHALIGFISSNCGNHYRWAYTRMRKSSKR